MMIDMRRSAHDPAAWRPQVFMTQAKEDLGVVELLDGVREHREFLRADGGQALKAARVARIRQEFLELLKEGVYTRLVHRLTQGGSVDQIIREILDKKTDPYSASEVFIKQTLGQD